MKKIKNKVLLTGISGYIGLHCAVELLKNDYVVKGSLRDFSKYKEIKSDISKTTKIFNWSHIPFEKTILDTAKYIERLI
tara:strand:+ start:13209 stop:13445 length:237 start_codon:yes stop_codon:yes gene_type:complete